MCAAGAPVHERRSAGKRKKKKKRRLIGRLIGESLARPFVGDFKAPVPNLRSRVETIGG
jgi:hypothetical protein